MAGAAVGKARAAEVTPRAAIGTTREALVATTAAVGTAIAAIGKALHECVKSATNVHVTLVPGSFGESETAGTMQWSESITASMTCPSFVGMPLTMALDYSFTLP